MLWLLPLLAFFLGSIPFGLVAGRLKGIDIRQHGSGNIGATNVFRVLGKGPGTVCLILDFLKGLLPVLLARHLTGDHLADDRTAMQTIVVLSALGAILGHNFSPWLGFKGGKGIATTGGALTAIMPGAVLILILIWTVVTKITKYVSVGSIAAAIALPITTILGSAYHGKLADGTWNKPLFVFSLVAGILAIWRHRANISRLRQGTEPKVGQKKREAATASASA